MLNNSVLNNETIAKSLLECISSLPKAKDGAYSIYTDVDLKYIVKKDGGESMVPRRGHKGKLDIIERYDNAVAELNSMKQERSNRKCKSRRIGVFIKNMQEQPSVLNEWSDTIWTVMIEKAVVHRDKSITFIFKSGTEIKVGD